MQLPSDSDISPEEAAEREIIRREIQEKMALMRQHTKSAGAPSPPPPVVKSPVQQPSPIMGARQVCCVSQIVTPLISKTSMYASVLPKFWKK